MEYPRFFAELAHPDFKQYDLSSLRTGIMAGSLCPSELMKKVQTEMHLVEMEVTA
jgi:fatty-acyl-CoA synthase